MRVYVKRYRITSRGRLPKVKLNDCSKGWEISKTNSCDCEGIFAFEENSFNVKLLFIKFVLI